MAYTTLEDVLRLLPHRQIDETTIITPTEVNEYITTADKIIEGELKLAGVTAEDKAAMSDMLGVAEAYLVAGMIESKLKADDGGEDGDLPNNYYYRHGLKMIEKIIEVRRAPTPNDPEDEIYALTGDEDELDALFRKNKREW